MKNNTKLSVFLLAGLAFALVMAACTDERTPPPVSPDQRYTETIILLENTPAAGEDLRGDFWLRDSLSDCQLNLTFFFHPDDDLIWLERLGNEVDSLTEITDSLNILITNYLLEGDTLSAVREAELKAADSLLITERRVLSDSLDTFLDDRFKVSIWLDSDTLGLYPSGVFLDSTTLRNDATLYPDTSTLTYLGDSMVVWGQGIYLTPHDSISGWRGMTMRLDLTEFWVADAGFDVGDPYIHPIKPVRGDPLSNQYPVRDWIDRLTPGDHTLHIRFAEPGMETQVTVTLIVVYKSAG